MNLDQFYRFWNEFSQLRKRAETIAKSIENRPCDFEGISEDGQIRYSYFDGCNCHGGTYYGSFSAEYLFDETWDEKHRKEVEEKEAQEKARKAKEAAEAAKKAEENEKKELERLKAKYEKGTP